MQKIIVIKTEEGEKMKNSTLRAISMGIAATSAAVALGTAMMGGSTKRTAKKLAKKAVNSVSGMIDNIQDMI